MMIWRALAWGVALTWLGACVPSDPEQDGEGSGGLALERALGAQQGDAQFLKVTEAPVLRFPQDHGAHPDYRQEWWYFTGNLTTEQGQRFGYQATIFRFALDPRDQRAASDASALSEAVDASAWRSDQLYMAHLAVTDVEGGQFHAADRFARGSLDLAGAQTSPLRVWVEDWSMADADGAEGTPFSVTLAFADEAMAIDLTLTAERPVLRQGVDGYSRKGDDTANASAYYSITRLRTVGEVRVGEQRYDVSGASWFDREWGTSFLAPGVTGWDWFSLQLDDGRDLMFYRLRDAQGASTPWSAGTLAGFDAQGRWQVQRLDAEAVQLEPQSYWRSAHSDVQYPVSWRLLLPAYELELEVRAMLEAQELRLATRYWEGAVSVRGRAGEEPVSGRGYLELAGY